MFQVKLPLERELMFTKTYQAHQNEDKALREAACLETQLTTAFRTFKMEDNIFAGTIENALVGFYTIFGDGVADRFAYCYHDSALKEHYEKAKTEGTCTPEHLQEIQDMIAFWQKNDTVAKAIEGLPEEWNKALTGYDYNNESGACYPLYRIAGTHLDAKKLLRNGLNGLIAMIQEKQAKEDLPLYQGMIASLDLIKVICQQYVQHMEELIPETSCPQRVEELKLIRASLIHVQENKPETLHQAIQLLVIYMLAAGCRDIGRLDDYLAEFYAADLKEGRITRDFAVRMVNDFFSIIEKEFYRDTRAIVGGMGREMGKDADEMALVVLDALALRPYAYLPQVSLRYYKEMDQRLYEKSLDQLAKGFTFPIIYNDDVNVDSVEHAMAVPRASAEQYAFFGCGEYMLAGKSVGTPNALVNVTKVLELALNNGVDMVSGSKYGLETGEMTENTSFDQVMGAFKTQMDYFADAAGSFKEYAYDACNHDASFLLTSILYDDCINRGKALFDGGIEHLGGTVETYGNITAADSLAAIESVVFQDKKCNMKELVTMLKADFEGFEAEQKWLLDAPKFGNDYEGADNIAKEVHEYVCNAIRRQSERTRLDSLLVVIINNNMNIVMGGYSAASADGRKKEAFLSNGISAYNGQDKEGITAMMRSISKMDTAIHAGGNQNLKFSTEMFKNRDKIKQLLGGYFALGCQQANLSVINQKDLEDALIHPENHQNLLVRVGGYTALFVYLDEKTQQEVLTRTAY